MGEILNWLSSLPVGGIGFAGLVTLAITLIFRGDIIPKTTWDVMRAQQDQIMEQKNGEIDMLKQAYRLSEEARKTGAEADKELLELGRTTVHLLESIHDRANEVSK